MLDRRRTAGILVTVLVLGALLSTQITLFVVQPIGAVPEGRTLIISRLTNARFIDSADAMCGRIQGSVNLLCRMAVMGRVLDQASIFARLPYSETLYSMSTGGVRYDQ
jgi:hypothetical protein